MPDTADAYIHRIGRTGRAQRTGDAFTLVTHEDRDMIRTLERIMGRPMSRETIEGFECTVPAPQINNSHTRERTARHDNSRRPASYAPARKSFGRGRLKPGKKRFN